MVNQNEGRVEGNLEQEVGAIKSIRKVKPNYPFTPKESSLLADGKELAREFGISFNQMLTFLVENAVAERTIPFMTKKVRKGEESDHPDNEGVYEKQ